MIRQILKTGSIIKFINTLSILTLFIAIIFLFVFYIGEDISERPNATVDVDQTNNTLKVTLIRNENSDQITVHSEKKNGDDISKNLNEVGEVVELKDTGENESWDSESPVEVIATVDSNEHIIYKNIDG